MFLNESTGPQPAQSETEANHLDVCSLAAAIEQHEFTRDVAKQWLPFVETAHRAMIEASINNIVPGVMLAPYIERLRRALDPIEASATACMLAAAENAPCCSGEEPPEPTPEQQERAEEILLRDALYPFHARKELREAVQRSVPM